MARPKNITATIYDKRGRVLSVGRNSYVKTHVKMARAAEEVGLPHKIFLHAEADAIFKCLDIDKAYRIQIVSTRTDGSYGNAKPCPVCESLIKKTKIKVIEHT